MSTTTVELTRVDDAFHMEGKNSMGNTVHIDGSPAIGGNNMGARPMELLLMGLGGCSGIDVISILKKQRQNLTDLKISLEGARPDKEPAPFEKIHVKFALEGELDRDKVQRAIELSMDVYCSAAKTLEQAADITWSFTVNGS